MKKIIYLLLIILIILFQFSCNPSPEEIPYSVLWSDGSKGEGSSGERGSVTITEIMWSGSVSNKGEYNQEDQFIEIQNKMPRPINISNWIIEIKGKVEKTYIIPKNEITIYPNQYVTIAKTNEKAFYKADILIPQLEIPDGYFKITLKDRDKRLIESVGNDKSLPFAGGYDLVTSRSMERSQDIFSNSGGQDRNWHMFSEDEGRANIHPDYRLKTLASPGEVNSKDYAGNTSSGGFE